jgi:hypothetical protein
MESETVPELEGTVAITAVVRNINVIITSASFKK